MKKRLYMSMSSVKAIIYMIIDAVIVCVVFMSSFFGSYGRVSQNDLLLIIIVVLLKFLVNLIFNIYNTITDHFSLGDAIKFCLIVIITNIVAFFLSTFVITGSDDLSFIDYIFISSTEAILIVVSRTIPRLIKFYSKSGKSTNNTMIVGAGAGGKIVFDEIHNNEKFENNVVCFMDNDEDKIGKKYLGKPVVGPVEDARKYIELYNISEVIIAIAALTNEDLKRMIAIFSHENVKIKRLPILSEMDINNKIALKEVSLAELLGREQVKFDDTQIAEFVKGKVILITGAGGSIGSELCRQIYSYHPKEMILFDIYENGIYDIQQELVRRNHREANEFKLDTIIGATYNEFRVEEIFSKYHPEIVFHAAAYKHVPLMEDSPVEAIRSNVIGTYNVAKMADKYKTQKMVLVSTDKAVRPTNCMGATKRFAEMIIQYWDSISTDTSYSAVRFGNVLGSNGSVIPLFRKQIEEGGPVTVTDPEIIRFFMTIPEAVSLILQSGVFAKGGEIFILDMGLPIKIVNLAENVIRQAGYIPYKDINIVFTGLRPGEKLYEETLLDVSEHIKTSNNRIYIEKTSRIYPIEEEIKYIQSTFTMIDNCEIKNALRKIVTTYISPEECNEKIREAKAVGK